MIVHQGESSRKPRMLVSVTALCWLAAVAVSAAARPERFCTDTTMAQFRACTSEVVTDFFEGRAICTNLEDGEERQDCFAEAEAERAELRSLCNQQQAARLDLCGELGEARYDPDFSPATFDSDFSHPSHANPYLPLAIGNRWQYRGGDETIEIEVLDETKNIEGVTCVVVRDLVEVSGAVVEDTDDWFALRQDGSVVYCGEIVQNFELFAGDDPEQPELVDVDGSWKAGRDGAKPGTAFPALPVVGTFYRQEFAAGEAEDVAEILSTSYRHGSNATLDALVPPALAALLCASGDCVVTREFTPISPDGFERKYYARGIGLFLEVKPADGEVVQLVACNFDPKCSSLPAP